MSANWPTNRERLAALCRCASWHFAELQAYYATGDAKHEPGAHKRAILKLSREIETIEREPDLEAKWVKPPGMR